MKWFFCIIALYISGCGNLSAAPELQSFGYLEIERMFFNPEDNPAFSQELLETSNWDFVEPKRIKTPRGVGWLRVNIQLAEAYRQGKLPAAIYIDGFHASEVYWNGILLGKNGVVGETAEDETPGYIDARYFLPGHLIKPEHNQLAIRFSARSLESLPDVLNMHIKIGPYLDDKHLRFLDYLPALLMIGAIMAGALYFGSVFLLQRTEKAALWLALMFVSVAVQFGAELYRGIHSYPYPFHAVRMFTIFFSAILSGVFMVLFVSARFHLNQITKWLVPLAIIVSFILLFAVGNIDKGTFLATVIFVLAALGLALFSWYQKQSYAAHLSIGLILFSSTFSVGPGVFADGTYYYAMTALAAALFVLQAVAYEKATRRSIDMKHLSNRLELDLLKQHIQPHFIMNTLMALSEWIVESPKTGVKMIQALAQEFRILNDISGKKMIPLSRELALCQAHVALMSYRKDRQYSLSVDLVDDTANVPPAVFHTLIENALTHNRYQYGLEAVFTLTQSYSDSECVVYIFTAPKGDPIPRPNNEIGGTGVGLSYIRARLKEAWGNEWSLSDGPTNIGGWETIIKIKSDKQTVKK